MKIRLKLSIFGKLSLGLLLIFTLNLASGEVPIPNPPKAKANFSNSQECVEPIEVIRRNHGLFLKHSRHDTMHKGIRSIRHSLVDCINCHVTKDAEGNYPSISEGSEHFCRSCHTYTAVTIDCFTCHASQPENASE
jgi:nitrate/TMAO reductase-like tetraheme cytochrome c subunit